MPLNATSNQAISPHPQLPRGAPAAGRWRRSAQGIVLDVGPARTAPSDLAAWLGEAKLEEELLLDRSVSLVLRWNQPISVSVVKGVVQGAARIRGPGVYAIYNPAGKLRYIGKSKNLYERFDSRFRVFRELGIPDFSFTVCIARVTETAPETLRASGAVVRRRNADPRKRTGPPEILKRAEAILTLAENALLGHFGTSLVGNRQPFEPIYRDEKFATVNIAITLANEEPPPSIPRAMVISIPAKTP